MLRVFNFRYVGGYLIKKFRSIEVFIYKFELNSGSGNILLYPRPYEEGEGAFRNIGEYNIL